MANTMDIIMVQKIKEKILIMVNMEDHMVMENMMKKQITEDQHMANTVINIMDHLPIENLSRNLTDIFCR
jgi:hypothetical protein